jgi:hypothetical protein
LLQFERDLLEVSRDKFELISHLEFTDLARLQEDRNRCAHPSMTTDGEIFEPSAELARVHIRSAVEHLLQYPAAQGKYAMDVLLAEVDSEYFPTHQEKALNALKKTPLLKARESLVRNFIIILLKKLLGGTEDFKQSMRVLHALNAVGKMHKSVYVSVMSSKLPGLVRCLDDENIHRIFTPLTFLPDCWSYLDETIHNKIRLYVERLPVENFEYLDSLLSDDYLQESARIRIRFANRFDMSKFQSWSTPVEIAERIVELYTSSKSFREANSFADTVMSNSFDFTRDQIEKVIRFGAENPQVESSLKFGEVINELRRNKSISDAEMDDLLLEVGLKKHVKSSENDSSLQELDILDIPF